MNIVCPVCNHSEDIPEFKDKKGWECTSCHRAWEVSPDGKMTRHLLANVASRTVDGVIEEFKGWLT